jgi:hypothetical protein
LRLILRDGCSDVSCREMRIFEFPSLILIPGVIIIGVVKRLFLVNLALFSEVPILGRPARHSVSCTRFKSKPGALVLWSTVSSPWAAAASLASQPAAARWQV